MLPPATASRPAATEQVGGEPGDGGLALAAGHDDRPRPLLGEEELAYRRSPERGDRAAPPPRGGTRLTPGTGARPRPFRARPGGAPATAPSPPAAHASSSSGDGTSSVTATTRAASARCAARAAAAPSRPRPQTATRRPARSASLNSAGPLTRGPQARPCGAPGSGPRARVDGSSCSPLGVSTAAISALRRARAPSPAARRAAPRRPVRRPTARGGPRAPARPGDSSISPDALERLEARSSPSSSR